MRNCLDNPRSLRYYAARSDLYEKESEMSRYQRAIYTLLLAGALLAGCDVSSPAPATTPTPNAVTPGGGTPTPLATSGPGATPVDNPTAYPGPQDVIPTPTFPPGYVPPTPQQ